MDGSDLQKLDVVGYLDSSVQRAPEHMSAPASTSVSVSVSASGNTSTSTSTNISSSTSCLIFCFLLSILPYASLVRSLLSASDMSSKNLYLALSLLCNKSVMRILGSASVTSSLSQPWNDKSRM